MHRARSGFAKGEFNIVFNFFRSLRAEIARHSPTDVCFVLEGTPRQNKIDSSYKGNRAIEPGSDKHKELIEFHRQKDEIIRLMDFVPISLVKHANFEADDTIYNIVVNNISNDHKHTIISSDTDFIQMANIDNVYLYNPIKKQFVDYPNYDYVSWKALRGDATDNIKGLPRIGDKTAVKLVNDEELFKTKIKNNEQLFEQFLKNQLMIKLHKFSDDELNQVQTTISSFKPSELKDDFLEKEFNSITNEKSWTTFVTTFKTLNIYS